jgi:hypothetical protein
MRRLIVPWMLILLFIPQASAQDAVEWGEVAGWTIAVDTTLGNSCFALTAFEDGTILRIGFDNTDARGPLYIMFGNQKWRSLEEGKDYDLVIQMDNEPEWDAPARGVSMGEDMVFVYVKTDQPGFLEEFTRKHGVSVLYQGRTIASLSLEGSFKAGLAMAECQLALNSSSPPARDADPFSTSPPKANDDPFA